MTRAFLIAAFLGCILIANYITGALPLIPIGFGLEVAAGTWFAGLTLVLRDALNESFRRPLPWVGALIVAGGLLSYGISPAGIAIGSAVAFTVAEFADYAIYRPLRSRSRGLAVIISGTVGAAVDTALFLSIARDAIEQFAGPITTGVFVGQFIVKALLSLVVGLTLLARDRRLARA